MSLSIPETASSLTEKEKKIKNFLGQIENLLPIPVLNWKVEFKLDNSYDPAVYIYPTIKDDENEDMEVRYDKWSKIRTIVRRELEDRVGSERFIYVRFIFITNDDEV